MTFRWPWRLKLTSNHQTNIFIWFLDPKNPLRMVSFVILTYFIFPIWPPAAILNFSKRSIVRIGHHVRNWSLDTILHESSVKKTISVGNWFSQKRPNFPQTTMIFWFIKLIEIYLIKWMKWPIKIFQCIFWNIWLSQNIKKYTANERWDQMQ